MSQSNIIQLLFFKTFTWNTKVSQYYNIQYISVLSRDVQDVLKLAEHIA